VAAVDTLTNAPTLDGLLRQGRLLRPDNSDGVIPGEAAAGLLLTRRPRRDDDACPLWLTGFGFARERATIHSDEPLRGLGLAQAYREALAESGVDASCRCLPGRTSSTRSWAYPSKTTLSEWGTSVSTTSRSSRNSDRSTPTASEYAPPKNDERAKVFG